MNTIEEKSHAVLGPSGWDRWSTCPGSVVLEEGRPNPTSIYAAWGTVAHEIVSYCLTNNCDAESFVGKVWTVEGHRIEVDMEMADACNTCIGHVLAAIDVEGGHVLMVEQEVPIGHLTGETGATGTADVIGIVNGGKTLLVMDHKFGRGVEVYAVDDEGRINGQLAMYGLGALEKVGLVYDEIETVELFILQPRISEEPSSVAISVEELRAFADEVTMAAGRVALARDTSEQDMLDQYLNPSEKACKFCRAKAVCPALRGAVESEMRAVVPADMAAFDDLTMPKKAAALPPPNTYSNETLAAAFRAIPLIEQWLSAVGEETLHRLMDRQTIPGLYLGEGKKGNRAWSDPLVAEKELKARYKVDEIYERKLISPSKAEKLMKPKPRLWAKVVEAAGIVQGEGKPKVCLEGIDKNRPYELPSADDFEDLTAIPAGNSEASALLAD